MIKSTEITMVEIDLIKPNPNNRNHHPRDQIERLKEIIAYQGFRSPLVVSNQSGFVVVGHGRYEAAKELGFKTLPVIFQDFDNPEQEYAHGVADNSIASWAELDLSGINNDLPDFSSDFNLDLLGIKDFVLDPAEKEPKKSKEKECPACGHKLE